jgi:2-polyprenyl-3-methyl-5-hydroxy-6-metoxy-1,4-benzoquinol methylase
MGTDFLLNTSCPVCGSAKDNSLLCTVDEYQIQSCKSCSTEFVATPPSSAELKEFYNRSAWFEGGEKGGYQSYDSQTEWSSDFVDSVLIEFGDQKNLSLLDLGCGYGTHLAMAARKGWNCFGVELSDHARTIATSRLGSSAYIVESIDKLIPHEFDLIFMLDVIEHLSNPYSIFYQLFSIGAITEKTKIIITTPNAGSDVATSNPGEWQYRHPPSHLVYYKADSLNYLLSRLQFTNIDIKGLHPLSNDEPSLRNYAGLYVQASGSNFAEFMRERYVPGTWSKLAEYEHMPRYALAKLAAEQATDQRH